MRIGVAIASCNEGPDLDATVALARASAALQPGAVVVVDDCSAASFTAARFGYPPVGVPVDVVRNETRLGTARSKARAADLLVKQHGCDAVVLLDAHMRMHDDWLARIAAALEANPDAVGCPTCYGFESVGGFAGCGGRFSSRLPYPEPVWLSRQDDAPDEEVPSVLGACYFMTAETWNGIGGLNRAFKGWGCDEADLSLRAWLTGRRVMRFPSIVVRHRFRRTATASQEPDAGWCPQYNVMALCRTLFTPARWAAYEPLLRSRFDRRAVEAFDASRADLEAEAARFAAIRTTDDPPAKVWDHDAALAITADSRPFTRSRVVTAPSEPEGWLPAVPDFSHSDALELLSFVDGKAVLQTELSSLSFAMRKVAGRYWGMAPDLETARRFGKDAVYVPATDPAERCEQLRRLGVEASVAVCWDLARHAGMLSELGIPTVLSCNQAMIVDGYAQASWGPGDWQVFRKEAPQS